MKREKPLAPPCETEIYQRGEIVAIVRNIESNAVEWWIKQVRQRSKQRVDWHYVGGAAIVQMIGEKERVVRAMRQFRNELLLLGGYLEE